MSRYTAQTHTPQRLAQRRRAPEGETISNAPSPELFTPLIDRLLPLPSSL